MQILLPQEVDCSTNHPGAANFMMIHFLGLGLGVFASPRIMINDPSTSFSIQLVTATTIKSIRESSHTPLSQESNYTHHANSSKIPSQNPK